MPTANEDQQKLLENILKLIKKFPLTSYEELTVLFIELLQKFKSCEDFSSKISELNDCELKRVLLEDSSE